MRKKLLQMGIDPETHRPRTDYSHLMHLTQLLGMSSNLGTSLSPAWSNNPFSLQADHVTQLANIQLLQNMLQIMSSNNPYLLGNIQSLNNNPLDTFLNGTNSTLQIKEPIFLKGEEYVNTWNPAGDFSQANSEHNPKVLGYNKSSSNTLQENDIQAENLLLPALVPSSCPGTSTFEEMDKAQLSTHSPSSTNFEAWEKFLVDDDDDDERSGSYWKEVLEYSLFSTGLSFSSCY